MKKIILKLIEYCGYDIVKRNKNERLSKDFLSIKYRQLVNETIQFYNEFVFSELPLENDNRISLLLELQGTQISEAIYILNNIQKTKQIEGDLCEFGIAQGSTSALMANEILNTNKNIWLFDSFEGLPKPTEKDILKDDMYNLGSIEAYQGYMSCPIEMVKERLSDIKFPFDKVKIVPGFIEETILYSNLPKYVSFAYIDFDFYEPIKIALEFLENTLSIGGIIIVDDYDFFSTGAKTAVDEFIESRKEKFKFILPNKSAGHFCIIERI